MGLTIDHDVFDEIYATEDFGDVDDEERKELVLDYMFHLKHVDIVPPDDNYKVFYKGKRTWIYC